MSHQVQLHLIVPLPPRTGRARRRTNGLPQPMAILPAGHAPDALTPGKADQHGHLSHPRQRFPGEGPPLPATGAPSFEWLEDQRFLIQRSHYGHPEFPDAITVTGIIDRKPSMHYFDPRGVHRVFAVDISTGTWRFWNDAPGFSQRFTGTLSDDGNAINGQGELSTDDGATWEPDLAITYRRIG
jgi:hypothetical protein